MNFATPRSRSAQFSMPVIISVTLVFSGILFVVLAILDAITGASQGEGFIAHLIDMMAPAWLIAFGIVLVAQFIRAKAGALETKSWPWMVGVFAVGIITDLFVLRNASAACGLVAATTYIFLFTRWFTGNAKKSGDK
jgi:hypothetical protein